MDGIQLEGLVIRNYSGFYYVQDDDRNVYECRTRGKLKDKIVTGDRVLISLLEEGKGILEKRLQRVNQLYRPKVANVNMVLIVLAFEKPNPDLMLLDRLLFLTEYSGMRPVIVLNKCDLPGDDRIKLIREYYPKAGFDVIEASTKQDVGLIELQLLIKGQIAVLAGPSGAGKSSLLNRLGGQTSVRTQEVSEKIGRGKHTTRHVELYPLIEGGWLADTPGFSVLELPRIDRSEFVSYFSDFRRYDKKCHFANCLHYKENECGVKDAVRDGEILELRYKHYYSMLEEIIENERCY
ncbi:MAG: ribosome small subunit-dependent GTPase A [Bacillota bacterium]|nr:ribosome small subunit-dependent GTPase A [Bacillota bacterium]